MAPSAVNENGGAKPQPQTTLPSSEKFGFQMVPTPASQKKPITQVRMPRSEPAILCIYGTQH